MQSIINELTEAVANVEQFGMEPVKVALAKLQAAKDEMITAMENLLENAADGIEAVDYSPEMNAAKGVIERSN